MDYVTFEARVEPLVWGDKTFTVLALPADLWETLGRAKRLEGEINEHPVNLAPSRAPADVIEGPFLWAGSSLLDALRVEPGDPLEVRLRPADPNLVEVPGDVMVALRSGGVLDRWEALTAGKRRGLLYQVSTAKRAETRAKRIRNLVEELAG